MSFAIFGNEDDDEYDEPKEMKEEQMIKAP